MNHGHVKPNADGSRARCGGPGLCHECNAEKVSYERRMAKLLEPTPVIDFQVKIEELERKLQVAIVALNKVKDGFSPEEHPMNIYHKIAKNALEEIT